jgi:plastocyanin
MSTTAARLVRPPEAPPRSVVGDRFVAGGMLTVVLVLFAVQVLAGHLIPPLMIFGLIYLALGLAIGRRRSRWLLVVIILLTLVHLGGSIPFIVTNLAHPESPASFIFEAVSGLAVLTVLLGAILGLRSSHPPRSRRPVALGAGGLAVVAIVVSLVAASGVDSDAQQPGDVPVEAIYSTFPPHVEVPAGDAVLWIDNQDPFHHTLVVDGTDLRIDLPGSTSVRMPIGLEPGTYRYFCDVPGHETMAGELDVR